MKAQKLPPERHAQRLFHFITQPYHEHHVSGDVASAPVKTSLISSLQRRLPCSLCERRYRPSFCYQNESDPTDNITEIRTIMSDNINNGVWTYTGSVLPDTSGTDVYSVDVAIAGYSLFGQFESCIETVIVNETDAEGNDVQTEESYKFL